jgi:hypothetical protein
MPPEKEVGRFAFVLRALARPDGKTRFEAKSMNQNVPTELAIMQLRAFLRNLENEYFENYDRSTIKRKRK